MRSRAGVLRAAVIVVATIIVALSFSSGANAADNAGCLTCHGTTLSVSVPDVDLVTFAGCKACHIPGLVGSHPYHQPGANCGGACHPSWGDSLPTAIPNATVSGASFASADSVNTSPAVLHIIHSAPRWPANVSTSFSECGSCHQTAACNACHTGAVASAIVGGKAQHGVHSTLGGAAGLSAYPSWTGTVGRGVTGVDQTINTIATETNQCAAAGCHNLEGTKANRSRIVEDYTYGVGGNPEDLAGTNAAVSYVGTWRVRYHSVYTGGRASYNNVAGAQLNSTFTGTRVEVISDKDPYRGKAEVWINGVKEPALLDCYSASTVSGAVVFSKEFGSAGPHTISIRPLNQKSAASRGTYVLIDGFSVYAGLPDSVAPACTSCHTAQAEDHGGDFSHEATHTAGVYSGFNCTDCHSINMFTEHGRSSSKTSGSLCAGCHTVYADTSLTTYDFTCGGTGTVLNGATQPCHFAGQAQHTFTEPTLIDAAHLDINATPSAALSECWSCHGKNLVTIHSNSVTSNDGDVPPVITSCLSCHGPAIFPTTADCTNAACHTVTGVHSMATHPAPPHMATNDGQGTVPRTGGKSCSTCHALEIANPAGGEHAKASSITDPGATAIGCVQCHAAPYFNSVKPWIDETVPYTTNTCIACHKVGSGLPSATSAGEPHELADYTGEHNYAGGLNESCGSTTMTCHSGSTTMLGNITNADTLHAVSKPGNADCTSCHTTNTAVPTQRQCAGCHTSHDTIPVHNSAQTDFATNADCLPCHSGFSNLAFGHTGCAACHDNDTLTASETRYLQSVFTGECLGCHNATVIGTQAYYTADPNHYNETTHTANIAADTVATGGTTIPTKSCTACHSNKLKAEHVLTISAANVNCIDCHTNAISTATINADWLPGKKCANCHGALHNSLGTSHDMSASAAALDCDGAGCHDGSNIATLHADRVLSTDNARTSCNVCHASADAAVGAVGCDSVGCHSGAGHSHPLSVPTSTYSIAAQTGCVASGAGCHADADTDYASLNYHPNAGCISGPCHTAANHNNAQFDNPNTCQNCHGGGALLYNNAPDVVATSGLQIADHYNETTHTATGLTTVVRGTTNGTAGAACRDCHDDSNVSGLNDWWYQHQGVRTGNLTCYGCHNKNAAIQAIVSDTTRTNTCAACHNGTVETQHSSANAPVVTGSSTEGCGASGTNCHTTYDLHELHKNSAKGCGTSDGTTNMVGCHDFRTQGIKPTLTTCGFGGGCHIGYTEPDHYAANVPEHTSTTQATATYALNGQNTTCGSCHIMDINWEHQMGTSALSGTGSVCRRCHNNSGSTTAITGNWSTDLCSACHDGTGISTPHANVAAHSVVNTGCGSSGVGCHPTSDLARAGADKSINIHNDCVTCHDPSGAASWSYGVAGNLKYNPLVKTCGGATGCHTSVYYSATSPQRHNIGQGASEVNGNDAKHTASVAAMATPIGAYANNNACSACHSSTLGTAHATTSMASDPSCTTGGTGSLGCHNNTALANSPTQVKANWTNDTCADCHTTSHTTYTLGTHTSLVGASTADANDADSCVSGGCHLAGATSDVRSMHDRATSGCTATGQDSLNGNSGANAACHALNKPMVAGTIGCGKGTTAATACHVNHTNANHGLSAGGQTCYKCHTQYQASMEDGLGTKTGLLRAGTVHHVMGSATLDGDIAPNAGTYPNTAGDVFCVSCHTDHNYFNGATTKAANLRTTALSTSGATTSNTDFINSGAYGVCVSCHTTSLAKQGLGTDQLNVGTASTPVIQGADYQTSAHQYQVASAFGASSTFQANCSKCHTDEQAKQYATGTYKFGTHYSATTGILGGLGVAGTPKEAACFKCHNATSQPYGAVLSAPANTTEAEFAKTGSTHDLAAVACINCHNVHEASAASPVANPDNTLNVASIATTATVNDYCLACHDGSAPSQLVNGTTLIPYTVTVAAKENISANYVTDGHGLFVDCRDCHEQHGSGLRQLLRETVDGQGVASYTDTLDQDYCLSCHRSGGMAGSANIARYYPTTVGGTKTQSAALPQAGGTRYGHRTKTAGTLAAGSAMPCRSCHNAHGGAASGYMLSVRTQVVAGVDTFIGDAVGELAMSDSDQTVANADNIRQFCFTCHTTSDTAFGWNGTGMTSVAAGCQVLGISRTGGALRLPNIGTIPGHKQAETTYNCYLCHGDDFSEDNSVNAHNPAAGESRGGIPCYTCHTVYQNRMEDGLLAALGTQRTTSYHHVLGSASAEGDRITYPTAAAPKTDVYCLSCHVDHDKFSPLVSGTLRRANNLRASVGAAAPTAGVNTDFTIAAGTDYNATTFTDTSGDWTNDANSTGAANDIVATSASDNVFEGRHSFTLPATINNALLTVRSRANGDWGGSGTLPAQTGVVATVRPTGDGDRVGTWTYSTGESAPAWDDLDEVTADDSTYIIAPVATNQRYLFTSAMPALPPTANNITVSVYIRTDEPATGVNSFDGELKIGSNYYATGTTTNPSTTVGTTTKTFATDPRDGSAWTASKVAEIAQFGVFAPDANPTFWVTQLYMTITYDVPSGPYSYDDTWAIQYSVNAGTSWADVVAANATAEGALTDHSVDLTGILTSANAANFRVRIVGAAVGSVDNANTVDWDSSTVTLSTGSSGQVCLSCHNVELDRDNTNQLAETSSNKTPALSSADYDASVHEYVVTSTFSDASTFNANCVKCHDSEIDGGGMEGGQSTSGFQTSANKFSVHYSAARRILGGLGVTVADPPAEEDVCYACHSHSTEGLKAVDLKDYYNVANMTSRAENIRTLMNSWSPSAPEVSTNTLYFRPLADGAPSEPMPNAHQTGDTFQGGTWIGRLMAPGASSSTYETKSQATNVTGTRYWRMVTFTSPAVSAPVSMPSGTWTIKLNARESNAAENAYVRYTIYKWNSADTAGTTIVATGSYATELGITAAPGTQYTIPVTGGAVSLAAGDKIAVCLVLDTRQTVTTSYTGSFYFGSGAAGNLLMPQAVEFDWSAPSSGSGHAVNSYDGIHRPSPTDETQAYISANKHVECADCHGVHASKATGHTRGTNAASGMLAGANGVEPQYTANTAWQVPTSYTGQSSATKEYQICFKCHSGANTNVTTWGGSGAAAWTDVALDFNPSNGSYHPVVAALPATDPSRAYGSNRLVTGSLRPQFTAGGWTSGGFTNGSTMYCSDCHASGDAASLGPHGSGVKWMLRGPNQAWPYLTRAANGTSNTTGFRNHADMPGGSSADAVDVPDGIFCSNCHIYTSTLLGDAHGTYDKHGTMPCVGCHVRVPHGSKTTRLIAAVGSGTYPGNMPLRLTSTGTGTLAGSSYMRYTSKPATGQWQEGSCSTNNCGTHSTGTVTNPDAVW